MTKQEPVPEAERLHGRVRINYSPNNPVIPYRYGYVREDNGGPKVKVWWRAADGPRIGYNVVAYHGRSHVQWIPRERLEPVERRS